jgi:hypothetical protein
MYVITPEPLRDMLWPVNMLTWQVSQLASACTAIIGQQQEPIGHQQQSEQC